MQLYHGEIARVGTRARIRNAPAAEEWFQSCIFAMQCAFQKSPGLSPLTRICATTP
jgi:hypothetical protein